MQPKLINDAPIKSGIGSFLVGYLDKNGVSQTAEFWEKEYAEHFIITFEKRHQATYPESIGCDMMKALKDITKTGGIIIERHNLPGDFKKPEAAKTDGSFQEITSAIAKVLTEKNKRYGNSALQPLNVFNGKSKVGQRADDKLSRIQNSAELRKNDVCDLIGYLILICKENAWTNFDDQID